MALMERADGFRCNRQTPSSSASKKYAGSSSTTHGRSPSSRAVSTVGGNAVRRGSSLIGEEWDHRRRTLATAEVVGVSCVVAIEEAFLRRLQTLKLGREEYCQRLLTMLILDGPYPSWNSRTKPSTKGVEYLSALEDLCFGSAEWSTPPVFVDEFELAQRHGGELGAAPDNALLWNDRLWMIELKTETSSHRPTQIPTYLRLARRYYQSCRIDLTYVTPEMAWVLPAVGDARLAHVTWSQVVPLITEVWGDGDPLQRRALCAPRRNDRRHRHPVGARTRTASGATGGEEPSATEPGQRERAEPPAGHGDPVRDAVALAEATSRDGRQRALDHEAAAWRSCSGCGSR